MNESHTTGVTVDLGLVAYATGLLLIHSDGDITIESRDG